MITRELTATEAREKFLKIIGEFARGVDEEYIITRKGKKVAAMVGYKKYKQLIQRLDEIEEKIELEDEEYIESIAKARKEESRPLDDIIKEITERESRSA